ncbi:MAG: hypothetical protein HY080_05565 [Gammaproteobacteria bacterium]|nr:hypothetical protein [Gammaproteobacteria bacterium]
MNLSYFSLVVIFSILLITDSVIAISGAVSVIELRLVNDKETKSTDTFNYKIIDSDGSVNIVKVYTLKPPLLDYKSIKYATASNDSRMGVPAVVIYFNEEGKTDLYKLTRKYLSKSIAIVIDNEVVSSAVIRGAISGGVMEISPLSSEDAAQEIANKINIAVGVKEPPHQLKQRDPPTQAYRCYAIEINTAAINTCIEHHEILNQHAQTALTTWMNRNKTIAEQYSKECSQDIRSRASNDEEFEISRKNMEKANNLILEGIKALPSKACEEMIKDLENPQQDLSGKRYK